MNPHMHPRWTAAEPIARALPAWLPEAFARHEAGETVTMLSAAYHANVWRWFRIGGYPVRGSSAAGRMRIEKEYAAAVARRGDAEAVTAWINAGRDTTLEANLARLNASNAQDEAHAHTAYIDGPGYWRERWRTP